MTNMVQVPICVCVAGVTGWTGRAVAEAIAAEPDLRLVSGVARSAAGRSLADEFGLDAGDGTIWGTVAEALDARQTDVLIDYTSAMAVQDNVLAAIERGVNVVVGSSGLTAMDYDEIDRVATERGVGVIAAGNFSILAALLQRFAVQAAALVPSWEIIDYASADKPDVPSGTARELAERMGTVARPSGSRPIDEVVGPREARGAVVAGTQVHSIRLPSYVVSTEVIFARTGERLVVKHDPGEGVEPYVGGTLLAVREVGRRVGLTRGLDVLLSG